MGCDVLEKMYYGNIFFDQPYNDSDEYQKSHNRFTELCDAFESKLSEEYRKEFGKVIKELLYAQDIHCRDVYTQAVLVGVSIISKVLAEIIMDRCNTDQENSNQDL